MSKIIALLSSDKKGGATTIAFNLANILKGEDKKVLIINNEFESSYTKILDINAKDIKTTGTIYPLVFAKYKKNVQILFLKNPLTQINNLKLDYQKILTAQAKQWKDLFDYVIFDTNYT
jgi:cellulose biosynthesis protein BcsQ